MQLKSAFYQDGCENFQAVASFATLLKSALFQLNSYQKTSQNFQLFARSNVSFGGKCFKTGDPNVLTHVSSSELLQALKSCLAGKSSNGQRQRANVGVSSALYLGQLGEGERGS